MRFRARPPTRFRVQQIRFLLLQIQLRHRQGPFRNKPADSPEHGRRNRMVTTMRCRAEYALEASRGASCFLSFNVPCLRVYREAGRHLFTQGMNLVEADASSDFLLLQGVRCVAWCPAGKTSGETQAARNAPITGGAPIQALHCTDRATLELQAGHDSFDASPVASEVALALPDARSASVLAAKCQNWNPAVAICIGASALSLNFRQGSTAERWHMGS